MEAGRAMTEGAQSPYSVALVMNRDLLFGSRIRAALARAGLEARFVPDTERFVAAYRELAPSGAIAILDMNGPVDWERVQGVASEPDGFPILAFGPHVDVEGRRAAKAAGMTRIVSNGQFHSDMLELIERYRR
jgi:hypothetical protein